MKVERNDMMVKLNALKAGLDRREAVSSKDIQQKDGSEKAIQGFIELVESGCISNTRQLQARAQRWMATAHRKQNEAVGRQLTGKAAYFQGAYAASMTVLSLR